MDDALKREEWDFSDLAVDALRPALLWEARRESPDIDEIATTAEAWLDGKLSTMRPPVPRDKRTGKRPQYSINLSEVDIAQMKASSAFGVFIPTNEFSYLHKWKARQRALERERWLSGYLRPLLKERDVPWLCLPADEQLRLCDIFNRNSIANVVQVGSWWDAVGYFEQTKPDSGLPLKFDYYEHTSVLLTINWGFSKKRILEAIGKTLNRLEPTDMTHIKRWNHRGKKDRDLLVMLERFGIMRLLHHYTLSEIKRRLPEAWNLYSNRKWYDERRRALLDFRRVISRVGKDFFPKRWLTKANRTRKTPQVPAKQVPISTAPGK